MKIVVFGSSGQLGEEVILKLSKNYYFEVIKFDSKSCNFKDKHNIQSVIEIHHPDLIINCAAYTDVDGAESNCDEAYAINREAVMNIAEYSKTLDCPVIHISTDYVFDGKNKNEYLESDKKSPLSVYGKSKSEGEDLLIKSTKKHVILRTSWLMGISQNSFIHKIFNRLINNQTASVVNDQIGKMTSVDWLSEIIVLIIHKIMNNEFVFGIYNVSCQGSVSWYDIAVEIANFMKQKYKKNFEINKIKIDDLQMPAKRPKKTLLLTDKIEKMLRIKTPYWKDEVHKILEKVNA